MARTSDSMVNMHKRLACGDTIKGYARGGSVSARVTSQNVTKPHMPAVSTGRPANPLTVARSNNGLKGMKDGGKVKKC